MRVLVYGGTGSQAGPTVKHLVGQGHSPHVLTRDADKASDIRAAGGTPVFADLANFDALLAASREVDSVAFLLPAFLDNPADAETFGRNAVNAASEAGVAMFTWNASGDIGESDAKTAILQHLQETGLPSVVFEPTTYMENWLGPWTAPFVRDSDELSYPVLVNRKIGWTASDDVGALVVAALERPELAGNRFSISGVETPTGPELATIFSDSLGRDIRYRTMSPEEMGAVLDETFGPGSGDGVADMYRREQEDPDPPAKYHDMSPVLEHLPVRMSTISEWVTVHKDAFC